MNFDNDSFGTNDEDEIGSDELLSDDSLRLPEGANILVRVHAVRAWLNRRRQEAVHAVGDAALILQEAMEHTYVPETRLRRRERQEQQQQIARIQQQLDLAQVRLRTYEEAQSLLEECIAHASGERVLVEYYLELTDMVQGCIEHSSATPLEATEIPETLQAATEQMIRVRLQALADVQQRVERIGTPNEDEG